MPFNVNPENEKNTIRFNRLKVDCNGKSPVLFISYIFNHAMHKTTIVY